MADRQVRTYSVQARSTDTFGRVLCAARNHHFVVDGPAQNGCPGEAVNPGELFLGGVAACGVELLQVLAKEQSVAPSSVAVEITGSMDRSKPMRQDVTVFNSVEVNFRIGGVTPSQAQDLVDRFKKR
jgi:organic hydroperoxide reductase OsmC/OhrA